MKIEKYKSWNRKTRYERWGIILLFGKYILVYTWDIFWDWIIKIESFFTCFKNKEGIKLMLNTIIHRIGVLGLPKNTTDSGLNNRNQFSYCS